MEVKSVSVEKYTNEHFKKYLEDETITEICYNGDNLIWVLDNKSIWRPEETALTYEKASAFTQAVAAFKKAEIQPNKPILSCILGNGERVQLVIAPATKERRISITIRKPSQVRYKLDDYVEQGLFNKIVHTEEKLSDNDTELKEMYDNGKFPDFIKKAVESGKNIVIAGETGSGKTTFMKSLIDFIPLNERIITIEDVEEIKFFEHKNYVQLFYPSEAKESDFLTSASLLKSCLRMKPDRILLAELRGGETYDFINVVSSGHNGSITSCHAGSVKETFTRLALMTLQNSKGQKIPFEIIEKMLKDVIDVVVHIKAHNGKRNITDIYYKGSKPK
jgi:type IV secretion system protein VirB11